MGISLWQREAANVHWGLFMSKFAVVVPQMPSRKNSQTANRCSAVSGADAQARVAQKVAPRATTTALVQPRARKRGKRGKRAGFPALSLPIAGTSTVLWRANLVVVSE